MCELIAWFHWCFFCLFESENEFHFGIYLLFPMVMIFVWTKCVFITLVVARWLVKCCGFALSLMNSLFGIRVCASVEKKNFVGFSSIAFGSFLANGLLMGLHFERFTMLPLLNNFVTLWLASNVTNCCYCYPSECSPFCFVWKAKYRTRITMGKLHFYHGIRFFIAYCTRAEHIPYSQLSFSLLCLFLTE